MPLEFNRAISPGEDVQVSVGGDGLALILFGLDEPRGGGNLWCPGRAASGFKLRVLLVLR